MKRTTFPLHVDGESLIEPSVLRETKVQVWRDVLVDIDSLSRLLYSIKKFVYVIKQSVGHILGTFIFRHAMK